MAIALHKVGLKRGDVFADLGCGTGKIAIEASRIAATVHAVDIRREAVDVARANIEANGSGNIFLHEMNSVQFLRECDGLDCAFVGGTKNIEEVLELLSRKATGRVVVDAVMISSLHRTVEKMKELDMFKEALQVQVSRSQDIAGGFMFKPIDPVFIVVGEVASC